MPASVQNRPNRDNTSIRVTVTCDETVDTVLNPKEFVRTSFVTSVPSVYHPQHAVGSIPMRMHFFDKKQKGRELGDVPNAATLREIWMKKATDPANLTYVYVVEFAKRGDASIDEMMEVTFSQNPTISNTSSSTIAAIGRCPAELRRWTNFEQAAKSHNPPASAAPHRSTFKFIDQSEEGELSSEAHVERLISAEQFKILNELCRGTGIQVGGRQSPHLQPAGQPDFVIHNGIHTLIPIEIMPSSVLPFDTDIVNLAKPVLRELRERFDPRYAQLTDIQKIQWQQIIGNNIGAKVIIRTLAYIQGNCLRYGVLTNQSEWWFFCRSPPDIDVIEIAGPITSDHSNPTVNKCIDYVIALALQDHHCDSPNSTPIPSPQSRRGRQLGSGRQFGGSSSGSTSTGGPLLDDPAVLIQGDMEYTFEIGDVLPATVSYGSGRSTVWMTAVFQPPHQIHLALKLVDRLKAPEDVVRELVNELQMYEQLSELQGSVIPRLLAYGTLSSGALYTIGTERIPGRNLRVDDTQLQTTVMDAYHALHLRGVIHGDVARRNIMVTGETARTVVLLDFGMARDVTMDEDAGAAAVEIEMRVVQELFGREG
ncbi:hypothetical protein HK097_003908 [Rhizophlyctis rosea]|uniref:Protein kinase domain-containing protein n=1 Tax=Rhizophlyctis rosea TaxID=64517 RepID=A0AAD5SGA3_9FUNG|nr:hypothetical protein HK097_003908 [Rhizophlyctis rosea]